MDVTKLYLEEKMFNTWKKILIKIIRAEFQSDCFCLDIVFTSWFHTAVCCDKQLCPVCCDKQLCVVINMYEYIHNHFSGVQWSHWDICGDCRNSTHQTRPIEPGVIVSATNILTKYLSDFDFALLHVSDQYFDCWQHKGAMSTFWRNWDFDTKW